MTTVYNTIPQAFSTDQQLTQDMFEKSINHYPPHLVQLVKQPILQKILSYQRIGNLLEALNICVKISQNYGVHSIVKMEAGGFNYTGERDTARCNECQLEVSNWTADMNPFTTHAQRSPACSFVCAIMPTVSASVPSTLILTSANIISHNEQRSSKRQKIEVNQENCTPLILAEVESLKKVRRRTFSHWPHKASPSSAQMVDAGFFNCNVGDRIICIYCNLVCQQWMPNIDDPWELHRTLSPKCPYVIAALKQQQTSSIRIVNEQSTVGTAIGTTNNDPLRINEIVYTAACHAAYIEIPRRHASFAAWPNENAPSVDDLVRAGFFYTGTKTIVTCFYCNGSLQDLGVNDNPMIEHARWFPHCAYAKQLCGTELYRKIKESERVQQERARVNDSSRQSGGSSGGSVGRGQLNIPDESTLLRFVAARLDSPISQSMLDRNFKLSIIKRCWADQLRLNHEDFTSDCDLLIACLIRQKQIGLDVDEGKNIIVPSEQMRKFRQVEQIRLIQNDQINNLPPSNLCVLCSTEEKRLACVSYNHFDICISCSYSIRFCPICHKEIRGFTRI